MRRTRAFVFVPVLAILSSAAQAADGDRTVVHLQIDKNAKSWMWWSVEFGQTRDETVIAAPGTVRTGKVGGTTVKAEPDAAKPGAYRVEIRSSVGDPVVVSLAPSEPVRIDIPRPLGPLPYRLTFEPKSGPKDAPREAITFATEYNAHGTFETGSCHAPLTVWDLTADGVFDRRDFRQGSAVFIDRGEGDTGRKSFMGGEIFEFCGKSFYVDPDSLAPDGSAVTVVETSQTGLKTGVPVPSFVMQTTQGETLHSENWKGKVTLLDFWASWCGYCIQGFPILKEMQNTFAPGLQIVSIDTDEPNAIPAARKVLSENNLPWPKIMSGKGVSDPVWMMAQSIEQRSLPLYILIGRDGVVHYGGAGGEELKELRAEIQKLVAAK